MVDFMDTYLEDSPPPPPDPNGRGIVFVVILLVTFVIATGFGGIRIYTKGFITRALGWDDYTCIITMILNLFWSVCNIRMVQNGMGRKDWELRQTYRSFEIYHQNAFAANLIYYATIMFVKLSILFLYLRTFTESRIFRHAVQAVMAVIISSHVAIIFILRYTVTRMDCHWRGWVSDEIWDKECHINISYNPLASVLTWISALTVVLDVIIMILPCRAVWRLHLPQRQKLAILITLLSGVVVTLASILRLVYMVRRFWYVEGDSAYTEWQVNFSSTIEINLALICISLPVLKAFTRRFFPSLLNLGSTGRSDQGKGHSSRRSKSMQMSGHHQHSSKVSRKRNGDSHEEDLVRHAGHPGYLELGEDGKSEQHIPMNAIEVKTAIDVVSRTHP